MASFSIFFANLLSICRRWGWLIYLLAFTQSLVDLQVNHLLQDLLSAREGLSPMIYPVALLSLMSSLIFPSVTLLIIGCILRGRWAAWSRDLNQLLIETLRSWGKALLWSLAFLLPGLVKVARLSFTPAVVLFSPAYQRGEVDALEESERLSKGAMGRLTALYFLMAGVVPFLLTNFDEFRTPWKTPLASLGLNFAETLSSIIFCLWLFDIYFKMAQDKGSPNNLAEVPL